MQRNSTFYKQNRQDLLTSLRNTLMGSAYRWVLKPLLFLFDPEQVHDLFISIGKTLGKAENTKTLTSFLYGYKNPVLKQNILGLTFENPVGLAAGFDKDANLMNILPSVGFGFEEIGSITAKPYGGNAKPRLTRLKKSKSLVVNYGLKSKGAEAIYKILKGKKCRFPIGTSIAKTNSLETVQEEKGIEDYTTGFKYFTEVGDYYTVNISCPNTFGGQPFHDSKMLDNLLTSLDKVKTKKPVFLKFSPDLSENQVDRILDVCKKHRVHGFVLSNLTKNRKNKKIVEKNIPEKGGLSGKVVEDLTDKLVSYVYKKTRRKYVIIGCGGIFSAEDAYRKIKNGASLVQLITGMIYEGPQLISDINLGLVKLLKKDGYKNISEAVGTTHLEKN
jgi:dihydroorotate dehydrogenase